MGWWVNVQQKTTGEREIEKFIAGSGRTIPHATRDHKVRSRQYRQSECGSTWRTCLHYGLPLMCFGIPRIRPNASIETRKGRVLVWSMRVLYKGCTRWRSLRVNCCSQGLLGEGLLSVWGPSMPLEHTKWIQRQKYGVVISARAHALNESIK